VVFIFFPVPVGAGIVFNGSPNTPGAAKAAHVCTDDGHDDPEEDEEEEREQAARR
jgi:hypothetical protein